VTGLDDIQRAGERRPAGTREAIADCLQEMLDARYRCCRIAEPRSIRLALPLR
jgi:hypothetical protein